MEDPVPTPDAGNGNEPPKVNGEPVLDGTVTTDGGNGNEPPPKLASSEPEPAAHPAQGWLDALITEAANLDEVIKNRLYHIVEQIRAAL